ncbi:MAG: HAD family hydrolase [Erysipelotrichaceae bacterium]|nr:HAD family hydrolase [Erysipelotrichaceae bacterium]
MKCIFIDIDGTLYDHKNNQVLDSSYEAIKLAKNNGHKVIICTGRSICESKKFLNLDVDGFVFCAGAIVYADDKLLYRNPFSVESVYAIADKLENLNLGFCLEGEAGGYFNDYGLEFILKYFNHNNKDDGLKVASDNGFYTIDYWDKRDAIGKMCIYAKTKEEIAKADFLLDKYALTTTLNDDEKQLHCRELSMREHHKSFGAKLVLDYFNLTFSDAIAIGDSDNDIEVLRDCALGIAMGNASESAKNVSDYITDDVSNHGIYNALKKFNII